MSGGRTKIKKDSELTPDELRARSVQRLSAYIEENDRVEEFGVGTWIKPPGFEEWHFVRFDSRLGFHLETAATMRRQGYVEAPKGTRLVGFENEWEHNLYLCAPLEIRDQLRDRKKQARLQRAKLVNDSFGGNLGAIESMTGAGTVSVKKRTFTEAAPKS